jgi:hypothetical protein
VLNFNTNHPFSLCLSSSNESLDKILHKNSKDPKPQERIRVEIRAHLMEKPLERVFKQGCPATAVVKKKKMSSFFVNMAVEVSSLVRLLSEYTDDRNVVVIM